MQRVLGILSTNQRTLPPPGGENHMAANYLEMLAKLQEQGLEVLKQAQAAHIQTLTSVREMVEKLPAPPQLPTMEGVPSIAELTALNTQFASHVLEQQKQYATQIADLFKPVETIK
ncbi:MAG: hypothetical protein NVSMB5_14200 [Candidatus Velthaea sp.]